MLISNYSIRTDVLQSDLGNFPLWNSDFFERDVRLREAYSRHSHIIDFDALRLGKKILDNNPKGNSFEFGVVVITEIGKERGNNLELKEVKKNDYNANPKNDKFNAWLKMVRHSATVDNFPFVKVIVDEQRPESWGADARDLCDVVFIRESSEPKIALPFFTLAEMLYDFVFSHFVRLYKKYRFQRGDNTLTMYILKNIVSKIQMYYIRRINTFGYSVLSLDVERGTRDGEIAHKKYYLSNKKIYSDRFATDAFSDFFVQKSLKSKVGIGDMRSYENTKATFEELQQQNSYFIGDLVNDLNNEGGDSNE